MKSIRAWVSVMGEKAFSGVIETRRLMIKDSEMEECEILQAINEASDYIEKWVGWKTPPDYAYKTLTEGNLPPGGDQKNFRTKTVYLKNPHEAIGVIEAYCGYPTSETFIIGWLFIHPRYQKQGYAREAAQQIFQDAKNYGFKKIRLGVHLKNWPALRFWQVSNNGKI